MENLERFIKAHNEYYHVALQEIRNGHKESHWIWFIFPNLKTFSGSEMSYYYGFDDLDEANSFLHHELLRSHLFEITEALLMVNKDNIEEILTFPDNLKVRSSITLFKILEENELFDRVLEKYYNNNDDEKIKMYVKIINKK